MVLLSSFFTESQQSTAEEAVGPAGEVAVGGGEEVWEQVGGWMHLHVAHARPAIAGSGLATALPANRDGDCCRSAPVIAVARGAACHGGEGRRERRVERAARHGAAEGLGGGWEKLCRLVMAAKAGRPRQQSGGGRRRARGSSRESQWTRRAWALSLEEQGVRQRVAQSLDARQPWRDTLRCMAATTPFRRTRGARDGARLGVCFQHIPCTFGPWHQ